MFRNMSEFESENYNLFLGQIAHEINNSLSKISNVSEILEDNLGLIEGFKE